MFIARARAGIYNYLSHDVTEVISITDWTGNGNLYMKNICNNLFLFEDRTSEYGKYRYISPGKYRYISPG